MKEKVYATNICLIPDQEAYDVCSKLNKLDTTSKYNINSREFIPHATLVMKYLTEPQIQAIQAILEKIDVSKIPSATGDYFAEAKNSGGMWSGIDVEKNPEIQALQNMICDITEGFINNPRDRDSYAIDEFFEEDQSTIRHEDEYKAKETLHITLGRTDIRDDFDESVIPEQVKFSKIVIGHMGNYGSVRDILYSKELH